MSVADLYIRVSTDEQNDGYSPADQEERLRAYCAKNAITVREVVFEDYSAKTFRRPSWTKLLNLMHKRKGHTDLVLFTKWDRFSRNIGDAYMMIGTLEKLGIEPQAIEQPLDLSIPESHLMLAIYLATPQVENMRRGLNVFYGMRQAKKDGRWMGTAPIGYMNLSDPAGKKYIAPKEKEAAIMKYAFEELANGNFNTEQIWRICRQKGLKCSKNNFWVAIRNPIYCGKIFIPPFKDEESRIVQGQHEPLISEALFYDAQDVLNGRKRKVRTKIVVDDKLPLRGFLLCPKCNKLLSGSASKGRTQYYHYYHCNSVCGFRHKAPDVNSKMVDEIKKYAKSLPTLQLYKEVVVSTYNAKTRLQRNDTKQLKLQLEEAEGKLKKARNLLLSGDIETDDYRSMKAENEEIVRRLEAKLTATVSDTNNIESLMTSAVSNIAQLGELYENGNVMQQRKIIGSVYPEKLTFDGVNFRTERLNEALTMMLLINRKLEGKKNGTNQLISDLSHEVIRIGFEPMALSLEG